jgi:hypothetical protein
MTSPILDRSAPLLSLDEFRRLMSFHPWHFWQLADSQIIPITNHCSTLVMQYAWQNVDAVGRANVLEAILNAERMLKEHLGYSTSPDWETDELQWPQYFDPRSMYLSSADAIGRWLSVRTNYLRVHALGIMVRNLIGDAIVVLADDDVDGLAERFTLTIATTVTDPGQIAVYFTAADRYDGSVMSERWRVKPISVVISGGFATITGRVWTIVRPVMYEGVATAAIDPTVVGNYASSLSVVQLATDTEDQGAFLWETQPDGSCCAPAAFGGNSRDPSGYAAQIARYVVRMGDLGYVAGEASAYDGIAGEWVAINWDIDYPPQKVRVNYKAGWDPENSGVMSERMKVIVARLAAAELASPICGCDVANRELSRWQFDLARSAGAGDEQYQMGFDDMQNPFGTRRGHLYAWKAIQAVEWQLQRASITA